MFKTSLNFDKRGGDKITQKGGKVKSCTPGKTFACGNACFTLGRNCKKTIDKDNKEKSSNLVKELTSTNKKSKKKHLKILRVY